ncbi:MAG TPA: DUF4450 domain-containing protein [Opitutaceae bacterium]|nr:DUF4450 domain-containing protein [Opitutaceae bacterium]
MKSSSFFPVAALLGCSLALQVFAQAPGALRLTPNLTGQLERPLRYRPDGGTFLIENGTEYFNRPLYGGNTAFRVDAGDRPEFSLYLPGRGGNLRLGLKNGGSTMWLQDANHIVTRYRPGEMLYEVRDPLLGESGKLLLTVVAFPMTEGLVVRVDPVGIGNGVELIWAYGGVTGQRGTRDGDIGTERVPISEYFQLKPEFCRDNVFTLEAGGFKMRSKVATILGLAPPGAKFAIADANHWASAAALFASTAAGGAAPELPVATGRVLLSADKPVHLALQRIAEEDATTGAELDTYRAVTAEQPGAARAPVKLALLPAFALEDIPRVFEESSAHFEKLRKRVTIETPDPYLNAAAASLNVAADAVWDEPQRAIMHGAIAWRAKLLGWRGPYLLGTLGWADRARDHYKYWAGRQNTGPVPGKLPPADENSNLARSEAALHSNGDMSNTHYDMNAVYIDALFRHLQWTGDLEFAREMWPVIERHLAWERRLFRREFGPHKLPLYEAYAQIWASDDLQYSGGGASHASAYNYYHNMQAARLAKLLGHEGGSYAREAQLIARAMREFLWVPERGTFAEFKDLLGLQLVHPSAALWTIYHTIDSEVPNREEAWKMTRYVDTQIPHLPVRGQNVPKDLSYFMLSSSSWMPYSWSINNVVMGENVHTALAYWQAGRPEDAFRITKSALLASMFMGICPGNVGSMNYLDVYRRESQRDFADGSGVLSRALVEGLFGVQPDALAGELRLAPGFPATWDRANLNHPLVSLNYRRTGNGETFLIEPHFPKPMDLRLQLPARRENALITVNGRTMEWKLINGPAPMIELIHPAVDRAEIIVVWSGLPRETAPTNLPETETANLSDSLVVVQPTDWKRLLPLGLKLEPLNLTPHFNDRVTEIFKKGKYVSPRSPFVSLALPSQGIGAWAGHVNDMAEIDDTGLRATAEANGGRITMPNGVPFITPGPGETPNVLFTSRWDNYPKEAILPLSGRARQAFFLMAGSTNFMQSRLDNGEIIATYNDGTTARLALHNPTTWWPIDQDYFIDDYQFRRPEPLPPRIDLKTGRVRVLDAATFKGKGGKIPGGAATVLELSLDSSKELRSLTVRTLANDVVIGLMGVTLLR